MEILDWDNLPPAHSLVVRDCAEFMRDWGGLITRRCSYCGSHMVRYRVERFDGRECPGYLCHHCLTVGQARKQLHIAILPEIDPFAVDPFDGWEADDEVIDV